MSLSTPKALPVESPGDDGITLSPRDFDRVAGRINRLAGIVLEPHKAQMIQTRLGRRIRAIGMTSIESYLDHLDTPEGSNELQGFVDTLTTNLTSFFREHHHFEHIAREVLEPAARAGREIKVWSAGCSTGEEACSIAMVAHRTMGERCGNLKILATDLDSNVLSVAKAAEYGVDKFEANVAPEYRRYFDALPDGQTVRLAEDVRRLISFRQLNLMEHWPMRGPFDAIFCRNVVIYFSAETKASLLARFAALLKPGGFLYLGHSEAILGDHAEFKGLGHTIYQRRAG